MSSITAVTYKKLKTYDFYKAPSVFYDILFQFGQVDIFDHTFYF